jgi:hypothetical protein
MDEDDDFFDMRRRIRIPDKKEKRKKAGPTSDSNSDSSSTIPDKANQVPTRRVSMKSLFPGHAKHPMTSGKYPQHPKTRKGKSLR